jgi:hypothetical protein
MRGAWKADAMPSNMLLNKQPHDIKWLGEGVEEGKDKIVPLFN